MDRGFIATGHRKPSSRVNTVHSCDPTQLTGEPQYIPCVITPLPLGHLLTEASQTMTGIHETVHGADTARARTPKQRIRRARFDGAVCHTMADGLRAMPPMPVPEPLARPGKRELDAARRLIARHGMPLVLAVAEWVSLPPSKTDKGDASANRMTVSGVARSPASLARHWDQVCLQMADDPHGRRLLAEHGILADKGETAQPPSAESTPKVPNYGIPDNLDRRVWKLLDPYDFDAEMTGSRHHAPCAGC